MIQNQSGVTNDNAYHGVDTWENDDGFEAAQVSIS